MPKPIPLTVAIFTISFLMIRRDLKNHHVANYGGGKTSLSRYAGLLASILSRAENLSHRCKSVPTGTLSANILTTSKHFLQTFWQLQNTFCKHLDNFKTLSANIFTTSKYILQTFWQLNNNFCKQFGNFKTLSANILTTWKHFSFRNICWKHFDYSPKKNKTLAIWMMQQLFCWAGSKPW